jgi:hypothetical protein
MTIDENAIKLFERIIKNHQAEHDEDQSIRKMYTEDRKILRKILFFYKSKKWKEAGNLARYADTAVRDMIPDSIWNVIIEAQD